MYEFAHFVRLRPEPLAEPRLDRLVKKLNRAIRQKQRSSDIQDKTLYRRLGNIRHVGKHRYGNQRAKQGQPHAYALDLPYFDFTRAIPKRRDGIVQQPLDRVVHGRRVRTETAKRLR